MLHSAKKVRALAEDPSNMVRSATFRDVLHSMVADADAVEAARSLVLVTLCSYRRRASDR